MLGTKLPASDTGNIYLDGVLQGTATTNASGYGMFTLTKPTTGFTHEVAWVTASGTGDAVATVLLLGAPAASPTPTVGGTPSPTPTATATATATATVAASPTPTVTPPAPTCYLTEGFDDITTLVNPGGWVMQNNSMPGPGSTGWFQGNTLVFTSQSGADDSYIGANFNNGTGAIDSEQLAVDAAVDLAERRAS